MIINIMKKNDMVSSALTNSSTAVVEGGLLTFFKVAHMLAGSETAFVCKVFKSCFLCRLFSSLNFLSKVFVCF
jgi:hypothetical protein